MKWLLKPGNILDEPADVLICSANVSLNLSGGVGADLLGRYGIKQQERLHSILATRSPHCAQRGEVFAYEGSEVPCKAILHAVAIDGWYDSSPDVIEGIVSKSLAMASDYEAKRVALTALATGFGHLSLAEFAVGIRPLVGKEFGAIEEVVICLMEDYRVRQLAEALPEAIVIV